MQLMQQTPFNKMLCTIWNFVAEPLCYRYINLPSPNESPFLLLKKKWQASFYRRLLYIRAPKIDCKVKSVFHRNCISCNTVWKRFRRFFENIPWLVRLVRLSDNCLCYWCSDKGVFWVSVLKMSSCAGFNTPAICNAPIWPPSPPPISLTTFDNIVWTISSQWITR